MVAQHPWVDDPTEEMKRLQKQKEAEVDLYGDFGKEKEPEEDDGGDSE